MDEAEYQAVRRSNIVGFASQPNRVRHAQHNLAGSVQLEPDRLVDPQEMAKIRQIERDTWGDARTERRVFSFPGPTDAIGEATRVRSGARPQVPFGAQPVPYGHADSSGRSEWVPANREAYPPPSSDAPLAMSLTPRCKPELEDPGHTSPGSLAHLLATGAGSFVSPRNAPIGWNQAAVPPLSTQLSLQSKTVRPTALSTNSPGSVLAPNPLSLHWQRGMPPTSTSAHSQLDAPHGAAVAPVWSPGGSPRSGGWAAVPMSMPSARLRNETTPIERRHLDDPPQHLRHVDYNGGPSHPPQAGSQRNGVWQRSASQSERWPSAAEIEDSDGEDAAPYLHPATAVAADESAQEWQQWHARSQIGAHRFTQGEVANPHAAAGVGPHFQARTHDVSRHLAAPPLVAPGHFPRLPSGELRQLPGWYDHHGAPPSIDQRPTVLDSSALGHVPEMAWPRDELDFSDYRGFEMPPQQLSSRATLSERQADQVWPPSPMVSSPSASFPRWHFRPEPAVYARHGEEDHETFGMSGWVPQEVPRRTPVMDYERFSMPWPLSQRPMEARHSTYDPHYPPPPPAPLFDENADSAGPSPRGSRKRGQAYDGRRGTQAQQPTLATGGLSREQLTAYFAQQQWEQHRAWEQAFLRSMSNVDAAPEQVLQPTAAAPRRGRPRKSAAAQNQTTPRVATDKRQEKVKDNASKSLKLAATNGTGTGYDDHIKPLNVDRKRRVGRPRKVPRPDDIDVADERALKRKRSEGVVDSASAPVRLQEPPWPTDGEILKGSADVAWRKLPLKRPFSKRRIHSLLQSAQRSGILPPSAMFVIHRVDTEVEVVMSLVKALIPARRGIERRLMILLRRAQETYVFRGESPATACRPIVLKGLLYTFTVRTRLRLTRGCDSDAILEPESEDPDNECQPNGPQRKMLASDAPKSLGWRPPSPRTMFEERCDRCVFLDEALLQNTEHPMPDMYLRPGECALVEGEEGCPPGVVQIEAVFEDEYDRLMFSYRWYWRRSETREYKHMVDRFPDEEVFLSDVRDVDHAFKIRGPCYVLDRKEFLALRPDTQTDGEHFFCRYEIESASEELKRSRP